MNISVIIPTYSNKQFLKNLINNLKYLKDCQIIVVNDNPKNLLHEEIFKANNIKLIENKNNLGFSKSVNIGIKNSNEKYILLLNDDVVLQDDSFLTSIKKFESNHNLFAISFAQMDNGGKISGKNKLFWKNGFVQHCSDENINPGKTGWAEGGSALFDRDKLNKLGGFDEIYSPFYWEDIDLSYRAKKMGYQVLFDPKIVVKHNHETTIGREFDKSKISAIAYRNQFIFIWKNISSTPLLFAHFLNLIKLLVTSILKTDIVFYIGFFQAILKLPKIILLRNNSQYKLSDHEILQK